MKLLRKLKRLKQKKVLVGQFEHVFIADMPDGHLSCGCGTPWFYVVLAEGERRIYAICSQCEKQLTLHFPIETDLVGMNDGELHCDKHPKSQMVILKGSGFVSVGCRNCDTEVNVRLFPSHIEDEHGNIIQ